MGDVAPQIVVAQHEGLVSGSCGVGDREAVVTTVRALIRQFGLDPTEDGLLETPRRIADMYAEMFARLEQDPRDEWQVQLEEGHDEMVILRDIPFHSMCEHHFPPFEGVARFGYLPDGRVAGMSKLARAVEVLPCRPHVRERLTSQIADTVEEVVGSKGVGVVIDASHLCMTVRGIRKTGARMVMSAMHGAFRQDPGTR